MRFELAAKLVGKLPSPLLKREALLRGIKQAVPFNKPPIGFLDTRKLGYHLLFLIPKSLKHGNNVVGRCSMDKLGLQGIKQAHPVQIMTVCKLGTRAIECDIQIFETQIRIETHNSVCDGTCYGIKGVQIRGEKVSEHLFKIINRDFFFESAVELFLALGHDCRMLRYRGGDVAYELMESLLIDSIGTACNAAQVVAVIKREGLNVILGGKAVKQLFDFQDLAGHAVCLNDFFGEIFGAHFSLKRVRIWVVVYHVNEMNEIAQTAYLDARPYALLVIQVDIGKRAIKHRHAVFSGNLDVIALLRLPACDGKRPSARLVAVHHMPALGHIDIEPAALNLHVAGNKVVGMIASHTVLPWNN